MVAFRALLILLAASCLEVRCLSFRADGEDDDDQEKGRRQGDLSKLGSFSTRPGDSYDDRMPSGITQHVGLLSDKKSAYEKFFNDPMWPKQWYLQDYRTEDSPVYDHNVVPVYKMNINGTGVIVAVVDEGIKSDHPDLVDNYVEKLSYDYVGKRRGSKPGNEKTKEGKVQFRTHGTRTAGVIAMAANNGVCGVGVAYGAKVAGVMIMGPDRIASVLETTDTITAKGLVHKLKEVDIYSSSWNYKRMGRRLKGTPRMTFKAISRGVTEGRDNKGAIYVFSAGNTRSTVVDQDVIPLDNCATDALSNNPNVIVIASASQRGRDTHYSEACTNVFATAYSAGASVNEKVVATDANVDCTADFGGTSAAAAIASGIIALVLSANKELTYRDVMHLIAAGSEVAPLSENNPTWYQNMAGFMVSNDFGFGLLNAENMVLLAKNWKRVPDKKVCVINVNVNKKVYFEMEHSQVFNVDTDGCQKSGKDGVFFLEHVELATTIKSLTAIERGDFSIYLTSPKGTKSLLMKPRRRDRDSSGFQNWSITSVHNWGEDPGGRWKIHVYLHDYEKTWPMLSNAQPRPGSSEGGSSRPSSMESKGGTEKKPEVSGLLGNVMSNSKIFNKLSPSDYPVQNEQAKDGGMSGVVRGFTLTLHGTYEKPAHYHQDLPYREYSSFRCLDATIKNI